MVDVTPKLLERIRAGDQDALAEYIEQSRHQLLAFIQRKLGAALRSKVEPEDIHQDVCAEAVTVHGALVVGEGVTWIGGAELHLTGDGLPNVEREPVPGFRRAGGTRPGMLLPIR